MAEEGVSEIVEIIRNYDTKKDLAEKLWKVQPYFYDNSKIWWLWDLKLYKWSIVDETDILNMVNDKAYANTINSKQKSEILESMKQFGRRKSPKEIKKTWVQFLDIIVDTETGSEFKPDPSFFVTNPIPYKLSDNNNTPTMDKIFSEWVGEENIKLLYQIIAFCLLPDYPLNRIFCFIGGGMNGKSKYLELVRKFIGLENCCSTELDTLMTSRFEVAKLYKKLICQMGETDFNEMSKTSMLKKLSGGDMIGFEFKNKKPFEDINYAKILIATNSLPATTDKTIGYYRRWQIIDFPNQFSEAKDILVEIPEQEYNNLARKSIAILKDLLKVRKFYNEGSIEDRIKRYEDKSNPIDKFMEEMIDSTDSIYQITKSKFSKSLNQWCKENRHRNIPDVTIKKFMSDNSFYEGKGYIDWRNEDGTTTQKRVNVWRGLKLK